MVTVAIVGAGLAGSVLAQQLKDQANVTVFEKSRGVGGRMSTRRHATYSFDHGAQYFRVKTKEFSEFLKPHMASGAVQKWNPKLVTIAQGTRPQVVVERDCFYVAAPGMTSLCKELSSDIEVNLQQEISAIEPVSRAWKLTTIDGSTAGTFDWVVLTAPALQTSRVLPSCFEHGEKLETARMAGCFTLMLGCQQPPAIAWDAAKPIGSPIGWIAVNSSKPGRPNGFSVVVQTTNEWAEAHLEHPKDLVTARLLEELTMLTGYNFSGAEYLSLHRWRYASSPAPAGTTHLIDTRNKLAACGDWCIKGRVEAAFTSAQRLADALKLQIG